MPTTEASPPPESTEEQQRPRARRSRSWRRGDYDGAEGYDLVHVIDALEDERARVALREKIWIALILHLLLFGYIIFAPKYIWHVKVRDVTDVLKEKDKQMAYLDLPPDALKQTQPNKPAPQSDKNRQQQAPKPTLDRKTLEALEAMRRAGPPTPKPQPAPPQQPAQQQPAPPEPAPKPAPPPVPTGQNAQVEAPKPQPSKPNFTNSPQTAGDTVQEAAKQARNGGPTYGGGDASSGAPSQHPGTTGAPDILSDTLGVDFGPYIQRVIYDTKRAWYPIIPEVAQPPISKQGRTMIRFKILPDGSVTDMHLEGPSGTVSLDRAAWAGIVSAAPFPTLPKNFKGPFLELRFYFLYNDNAGIH